MRLKFGMTGTTVSVNTCIIIVEIEIDGEISLLGALADSVQEVLELDPGQIEPPPRIGTRLKTQFIKGMGHQGAQFVIILDIDKVFSAEELAIAREMRTEADVMQDVAV
jgi:purine-binding chemotaxis protein CheW